MTQAPVMIGLRLPDVDTWSDRVVVALGQNPGIFTGPGTNTYLVGTGRERILLDAGGGKPAYLPVLAQALERAGGVSIQEIVVTHGHPDHMRGAAALIEHFGPLRISKHPWPGVDEEYPVETTPLADGALIRTEGATLRAVHTPGHSEDHLCFVLEEEGTLFSGDNVLGVGTAVIPARGGDLFDYLHSLERLLAEQPRAIYPAHGPYVPDGTFGGPLAGGGDREAGLRQLPGGALPRGRRLGERPPDQARARGPRAARARRRPAGGALAHSSVGRLTSTGCAS